MENNATSMLRYHPEHCNCSEPICVARCNDNKTALLEDLELESRGRVLEVSVKVKNICPGKRTAVAILLHELDCSNNEYPRGLKTFTLPAHHEQSCRDVMLEGIRFVLPEDMSMANGCAPGSTCGQRRFIARTIAHYVDTECGCECECDEM